MSSRKIKRNIKCLKILGEIPGLERIEIKTLSKPTYRKVLMCLLTKMKQMQLSKAGRKTKMMNLRSRQSS